MQKRADSTILFKRISDQQCVENLFSMTSYGLVYSNLHSYNGDTVSNLNLDVKIICDRIDQHFHPRRNHQYHIDVVNVPFLKKFNFFYRDIPKDERQKSIPLHTIESQDITYLETVLRGIRQHTKLSFEYHGFIHGERWASTDKVIEPRPTDQELPAESFEP